MKYFMVVSATDANGHYVDYIRDDNGPVSPKFGSIGPLLEWMRLNGWRAIPYGEPWEVIQA